MHREPRVLEAEAQVVECFDCLARITSKKLAPLHSVKIGILRSACSTSQKMDVNSGISALTHTARLTNSPARSLNRMVTKLQWLFWRIHDNWVAYFRIWSRRSLHRFCRRAQTYWSQTYVFNSLKQCYVMLTFQTKNHRFEIFAQVILITVTPMLQNLRIGLKKRRKGKSDVPVKQRGSWPKIYPQTGGET